ncbi:H+/oligopeptide symporter [Coniochaeta sp. 2T2.1]|nr:H+/oligopeptide symporter [Coniochaeta sp. 2T2.1]
MGDIELHASTNASTDLDPSEIPTEHELKTLRRVPGSLPLIAYYICAVEFAERSSYYGISALISNYVNRKLPVGGNGFGAPKKGTQQTAGALGMGTVKANAVNQSFSMLSYGLPLVFGYIADAHTGRFKLICIGIVVFGLAHVLMVGSAAPSLLANGNAKIPFFISLYMLSLGTGMFKPNIAPLLLDQNPHTVPRIKVLKSGERVIIDPEATSERTMTWFYLMINIGGLMALATTYSEKLVGWWLAFILPLFMYLPLPALMFYLRKRIITHPPGGSDLPNCFRVLRICLRHGGLKKLGRAGFWEPAKPSVIAARGLNLKTQWNDEFVEDVRRTFQAAGIFAFVPAHYLNDNGIGQSASFLSTMLSTNGVPNDLISNFNSISIIVCAPIVNYGLYPLLRRWNIKFGPIRRITFGLFLSAVGGAGYTLLCYYAYKLGPCRKFGSSKSCVDADGVSLVAPISVWWIAIPYAVGGISEIFISIPAYHIAYSRAPKNLKGVVFALYLLATAVSYIIGLASSSVIKDPYLTWDFGGACIACVILTIIFWFMFSDLDKEEYRVSNNGDYHLTIGEGERAGDLKQTEVEKSVVSGPVVVESSSLEEIGEIEKRQQV